MVASVHGCSWPLGVNHDGTLESEGKSKKTLGVKDIQRTKSYGETQPSPSGTDGDPTNLM